MLFTRVGTSLLSPIQWKAYAKLPKQQLLNILWWYFITGSAGWNCTFLLFSHYQLVLQIFDMFLYHHPFFKKYSFYRNMVHMSWNFLLTTHDQDRTNVLILLIVLGIYISWSLLFPFLSSDSLRWIITTCA